MLHRTSPALLITILLVGCTAELATPRADIDREAGADDPATIDAIDALIVANASARSGAPVTLADAATVDSDGDGIPDEVEETMLRRYRPYYRFSLANGEDESYRPADVVAVMTSAQLVMDEDGGGTTAPVAGCGRAGDAHLDPPESLYECAPDASLAVSGTKATYALNLDNTMYHGVDFATAQSEATGLYGHVAPTTINGHDAYKIEYWQFFAFNNQDISIAGIDSFGDHEGDWTSVQVWFDRVLQRIVHVRYLIHGKEAVFDIPAVTPSCTDCTIELHGASYDPDPPEFFSNVSAYSNNAAQFYVDDQKFKHVVVYIERGAHEFWPGAWGHAEVDVEGLFTVALNPHHGDGTSYLVPNVTDRLFDMGEMDAPMTREGRLILPFDGFWGSTNTYEVGFWGPVRRSPVGPALHCSWRWPVGGPLVGCEN
jgi:hypothetical protein